MTSLEVAYRIYFTIKYFQQEDYNAVVPYEASSIIEAYRHGNIEN